VSPAKGTNVRALWLFAVAILSVVFLRQPSGQRRLALLQAASLANKFGDCKKSDRVGLLQQHSISAVPAPLRGESTADPRIALPINRLRLKGCIPGRGYQRTRSIGNGNVRETPERDSQAHPQRPVRETQTTRREQYD
jgi:hypothetical protein